jgi:hypothetical protein
MLKEEIIGKRVRLIRMEDPYTKLKSGDEGLVTGVDDLSQIMVKWDDGSSLSLIPDLDEYEILESRRIKLFLEFVKNYESSYVDEKLSELEELVMSFSDGKDLMYEWKNEDDHNIVITYQINGDSFKYELDIDSGFISKTQNDKIVMEEIIDSVEEGLDMIEKDMQSELGISENYDFLFEELDRSEEICNTFIDWLSEKDFNISSDINSKLLSIFNDDTLSPKDKSERIVSFIDMKFGVDEYSEMVDYVNDLIESESPILEKNVAVDQSLWSSCKSWAKTKYDVWPSAYAVGAAAKRYKKKGGKWRKEKKKKKK